MIHSRATALPATPRQASRMNTSKRQKDSRLISAPSSIVPPLVRRSVSRDEEDSIRRQCPCMTVLFRQGNLKAGNMRRGGFFSKTKQSPPSTPPKKKKNFNFKTKKKTAPKKKFRGF